MGRAIAMEKDALGNLISQPTGFFVYQKSPNVTPEQYTLPLRYSFVNEFKDHGSGVEAGFFVIPTINNNGQVEDDGALMYLSKRTVKSQLARLYLYDEDNPNFKLVHAEDDFLLSQVKAQNPEFTGHFVYSNLPNYPGFKGPIKIWEINYPSDLEKKDEYLETVYPDLALRSVR